MSNDATHDPAATLVAAERQLFTACGIQIASRRVALADPPLAVRVLEAGEGPPLLLVHGSGMTASSWAPLMPHLVGRRLIALDLPGSLEAQVRAAQRTIGGAGTGCHGSPPPASSSGRAAWS